MSIYMYVYISMEAVGEEGAGGEPMGGTYSLLRASAEVAEARSHTCTCHIHPQVGWRRGREKRGGGRGEDRKGRIRLIDEEEEKVGK